MTKPTQYSHVYSVAAGEIVEDWVAPCDGHIWFDEVGLLGCREVYPTAELAQAVLKVYVDTVLNPVHTPAYAMRRRWLQLLGFTDDEMQENCRQSPPTNLLEESEQYEAMVRMIRRYGDIFATAKRGLT